MVLIVAMSFTIGDRAVYHGWRGDTGEGTVIAKSETSVALTLHRDERALQCCPRSMLTERSFLRLDCG